MRVEPSKLAPLVIAYHEKFGRYVPAQALRLLDAGDLVPIVQDSLATGVPLSETGWASPIEFSPRGCIMDERATPTKLPSGEWLH
jgi:hypothetical protein